MKKKNNNTITRSNFRERRNLILYNNINKLILKIDCDSENKTKYSDDSDDSFINNILKFFFFRSYSVYYFCISKVIFGGARRRYFD